MPGAGIEGLLEDLRAQGPNIDRPAYRALLARTIALLDGWMGRELAAVWSARHFSAAYERPLLLLASLRYGALREGRAHPLHAALVQRPAELSAITDDALRTTLTSPRVARALRERAVQTNETLRAVAWLWPAHLLARAEAREPLILVDLGASAGLNLIADALPAPWTDGTGTPLVVAPRPEVALRLGFDRVPLDARDEDDACWLRACVWQDDVDRLERLDQALAAFAAATAAGGPRAPRLVRCQLGEIAGPLAALPSDHRVLLVQSVVRDYLPADELVRYEAAVRSFLAARPTCAALWVQLELRHTDEPFDRSAVLAVTLREPSGGLRERVLARTHAHTRTLHVDEAEVDALIACLSARASLE